MGGKACCGKGGKKVQSDLDTLEDPENDLQLEAMSEELYEMIESR